MRKNEKNDKVIKILIYLLSIYVFFYQMWVSCIGQKRQKMGTNINVHSSPLPRQKNSSMGASFTKLNPSQINSTKPKKKKKLIVIHGPSLVTDKHNVKVYVEASKRITCNTSMTSTNPTSLNPYHLTLIHNYK